MAQTKERDGYGPLAHLRPTVDSLWTNLAPLGKPVHTQRILFTSIAAGQGTTTVTACAALGLALHLRAKVTALECGSPSSALANLLGASAEDGLAEVLAGKLDIERALAPAAQAGLRVLGAGHGVIPSGRLADSKPEEWMARLAKGQDFVLLDVPSLLDHPEMRPLLWNCDAAVVVLESGKARKSRARLLAEQLSNSHVELIGCVLNRYEEELPAWIGGSAGI